MSLITVPAVEGEPVLRTATPEDRAAIDALMAESAAAHFPRFYSEPECSSAVRYIASVDPMLLEYGTYYVLEADGRIVALEAGAVEASSYTGSGDADDETEPARGFSELALMSTMPGLPLYLSYPFERLDDVDIPLPDRLAVAGATMSKPIDA